MKLNIVVPIYNECEVIENFYKKTKEELGELEYQFLFVDDGSTDNTLDILKKLYNSDKKHIKIVSFSRNFGKESAIYAGLKNSNAKYTAIIDADLQQNPKYLVYMNDFLDKNDEYDCVCMCQKQKKNRKKESTFYNIMNKTSDIKLENGASDFRMFRDYVVTSIISLSEKNRFSKGIFSWIGFKTYYKEYQVEERKSGKTKWTFKSLLKYAIEGFVSFSTKPLKISMYAGIITSVCAFIYLIAVLIKTLVTGIDLPGYASLICIVLFLGGIQLLCMGILSQYIAKTYIETKNRPIFIEKEKIGFDDSIL